VNEEDLAHWGLSHQKQTNKETNKQANKQTQTFKTIFNVTFVRGKIRFVVAQIFVS